MLLGTSPPSKKILLFLFCPPIQASAKIVHSTKSFSVNQPVAHADLIATYKRAQADADHKFALIKKVAAKGPKAIQAAADTAAKAAKRRDSYAAKLAGLGVDLKN